MHSITATVSSLLLIHVRELMTQMLLILVLRISLLTRNLLVRMMVKAKKFMRIGSVQIRLAILILTVQY